jgi:very-short-patch-repair endonuclease
MYVFRSRAGEPPPWQVNGVDVVAPALCLGQLAEDLRLIDLVIAIDSALHLGLCSVADIIDSLRRRQRGLPMLRQALNLCNAQSESPWESILRLLLVTSGIEVEVQPIINDDLGEFIARADLRIKGTRRLSEYDGASHRDREQHQADLAREKALARSGWERFGYIAREILEEPAQIVRDAEIVLGLPPDPERVGTWLALAEQSSLTSAGRRRLARRLHRFDRPLRGRASRRTP